MTAAEESKRLLERLADGSLSPDEPLFILRAQDDTAASRAISRILANVDDWEAGYWDTPESVRDAGVVASRLAQLLAAGDCREVTCVWCGHGFTSDARSQARHLYDHAIVCARHPVRLWADAVAAVRKEVLRTIKAAEARDQTAVELEGFLALLDQKTKGLRARIASNDT